MVLTDLLNLTEALTQGIKILKLSNKNIRGNYLMTRNLLFSFRKYRGMYLNTKIHVINF